MRNDDRDPRSDLEAERSLLGACFTAPIALGLARALVRRDDFALAEHGAVFAALCDLADAGRPADLVTLQDALRAAGALERVQARVPLDDLDFLGPGAEQAERYAQIIADHAEARRMRALAQKLYRLANDPRAKPESLRELGAELARSDRADRGTTLDVHMATLQAELEAAYAGTPSVVAHTTGLAQLDRVVGGLRGGQLVVLAGKTGHGKSALAMTMALSLAQTKAPPSLLVSLEMPGGDLAVRAAAYLTSISQTRLRAAQIDQLPHDARFRADEIARVESARKAIAGRIRTVCPGDMTVAGIRDVAVGMKAGAGLSAIFVDYLQLMGSSQDHRSREREVAEVSRGLKSLAMELDVCVVALSQLSRKADEFEEPSPALLRESGQIENDATAVVFVWPTDPPSDDRVRLFVPKSRFSQPCNFEVRFHRALSRFADLDSIEGASYAGGYDAE